MKAAIQRIIDSLNYPLALLDGYIENNVIGGNIDVLISIRDARDNILESIHKLDKTIAPDNKDEE